MCKFIELRDESGDICLINTSEIASVYGGANGRALLVLKSLDSFTPTVSFAEIKKILGVKSDGKS